MIAGLTSGHVSVRVAGWGILAIGVGLPAIILPILAWFSQTDDEVFDRYVGWSSILAVPLAAVGVVLVAADRMGGLGDLSHDKMVEIANTLAAKVIRQETKLLSQLLGTDSLDRRPAALHFTRSSGPKRGTKSRQPGKIERRSLEEIAEYYRHETRGRMLILGAPGSGKTVLAASLTVGLAETRDSGSAVPVRLNIGSWEATIHPLTTWLTKQLSSRFRMSKRASSELVRSGWILPVLDGMDELDSPESNARQSASAVKHINDYIASTARAQLIVTCRSGPAYYERLKKRIRDVDQINLCPIEKEEAIQYIETHCQDQDEIRAWRPVFDYLAGGPNSKMVRAELCTPWRLVAAMTFFLDGGNPTELIPQHDELARRSSSNQSRPHAYATRVTYLLTDSYILARARLYQKYGFTPERVRSWLRYIALSLDRPGHGYHEGNEIVPQEWWRTIESSNSTKSQLAKTQAYVMWILMHLPLGIYGLLPEQLRTGGWQPTNWQDVLTFFANYAFLMFGGFHATQRRRGPVPLDLHGLTSPRGIMYLIIGNTLALVMGFSAATAFSPIYGISMGLCLSAISIILAAALGRPTSEISTPLEPLKDDRTFSALSGVMFGVFMLLYYATLFDFRLAMVFATMAFFTLTGSSAYFRYLLSTWHGRLHGLPLRFGKFLEWCNTAGILRTSGIAYQFRHQEIYDYLRGDQEGSSTRSAR